jgi:hypothetical protein
VRSKAGWGTLGTGKIGNPSAVGASFEAMDQKPSGISAAAELIHLSGTPSFAENDNYILGILAEGVGFEPTVPLQARRFSRPVP